MKDIDYVVEYHKLKRKLKAQESHYLGRLEQCHKEIEKLKGYIKNPIVKTDYNLMAILSAVGQATDVVIYDILSQSRKFEIVSARHLFCYVAYIHNRYTLSSIGLFINRDHSTVINAVQQFENYLELGYKKEQRQYKAVLELLSIGDAEGVLPGNNLSARVGS